MKKTMGDRFFMVAAPALWNSLPLSVRQAKDIDDFKRSVKYYLFSKAFCKNWSVEWSRESLTKEKVWV